MLQSNFTDTNHILTVTIDGQKDYRASVCSTDIQPYPTLRFQASIHHLFTFLLHGLTNIQSLLSYPSVSPPSSTNSPINHWMNQTRCRLLLMRKNYERRLEVWTNSFIWPRPHIIWCHTLLISEQEHSRPLGTHMFCIFFGHFSCYCGYCVILCGCLASIFVESLSLTFCRGCSEPCQFSNSPMSTAGCSEQNKTTEWETEKKLVKLVYVHISINRFPLYKY